MIDQTFDAKVLLEEDVAKWEKLLTSCGEPNKGDWRVRAIKTIRCLRVIIEEKEREICDLRENLDQADSRIESLQGGYDDCGC